MLKKRYYAMFLILILSALLMLQGCGKTQKQTDTGTETEVESAGTDKVADCSEMSPAKDVVSDDMSAVTAEQIEDGVYDVKVDSSSSMFNITECKLAVQDGKMTAVMTMSGKGYLYVYMGTGEEAAKASESDYIPYEEKSTGEHTYTVPVEALDLGIDCAAFSKRKEKWYDRTLVFRSDSLSEEALGKEEAKTAETISLKDGEYSVNVTLEGGSGRANVESPAKLTVKEGKASARLIWSSSNFDYMVVDGKKYLNESEEGNSVFTIPVAGFNYKMSVTADTTAMSTPHEIEYTLDFELAE